MPRNNMMMVDWVKIKSPSSLTWGQQDISASDAGRTDDTIMHKNRVGQKVTLKLARNGMDPDETSTILKAFDPEYFHVTYHDPKENKVVTKEFYSGDKEAKYYCWTVGNKLFESISFNIIER